MAFSVNTPVGDGSTVQFAVNFTNGIFSRDSVTVTVDGELDGAGDQIERAFTWINDGLIELTGAAPAAGVTINIRRIMDKANPAVDYADGEILTEENMDRSNDQLLNALHELFDGFGLASVQSDIAMNGNYITGLPEPVTPDGATPKEYVDERDANLQLQINGGIPLAASAFSAISWHDQVVENTIEIPANKNAWSFGPSMSIAAGQSVTIGTGSFWTIANGEVQ